MTLADVKRAVERIKQAAAARDYEAAHGYEDELYRRILEAAANGTDVRKHATLALSTQHLTFGRYCA